MRETVPDPGAALKLAFKTALCSISEVASGTRDTAGSGAPLTAAGRIPPAAPA
jgi:hypothetical protein